MKDKLLKTIIHENLLDEPEMEEYPRTQLVRAGWMNLNGEWDFCFDDEQNGMKKGYENGFSAETTIKVPYTYETIKSGIHEETFHSCVWYQKHVVCEPAGTTLLHFEGSDFETCVWVNGEKAGIHKGGYERFTMDLSDLIHAGDNLIVVRVRDSMDMRQPRGKQRWLEKNYKCWYVQTTGIWKTVWLEFVGKSYIRDLKLTPVMQDGKIRIETEIAAEHENADHSLVLRAEVSFHGKSIGVTEFGFHGTRATIEMSVADPNEESFAWSTHAWTPEHPDLYDLRLELKNHDGNTDEAVSYFGMREIRVENGNILLNDNPLYEKLILDQGYWPESGMTPPDKGALEEDINKLLALGFNGARKHMKTEDERFYYLCDRKGVLVWGEMAAFYEFGDDAVSQFTQEWLEVVKQNYSHPCIITWTPLNESWGVPRIKTKIRQQDFSKSLYFLTKSVDQTRPVIVNDGWEHTVSDIISLHDYEEFAERFLERYLGHKAEIMSDEIYHCKDRSALANGCAYAGQPIIISEYGGIAFCTESNDEWGYGNAVRSEKEFLDRYRAITEAIQKVPYIKGYCYTQLTDVQQEVNGLLRPDRSFKVDPVKVAEINHEKSAFHE